MDGALDSKREHRIETQTKIISICRKHQILLFYTGLCTISFFIIYGSMILGGYSNIYLDIGADTFCNYLPNYIFSKELFANFTFWDTTLGLGSETSMQVANYLADPFAWIVMLFDVNYIMIGLWLSLTAKYVCLCIFSYQYFKTMGLSREPLIMAALSTNFCGWMVGWGQHYHFASFFVLFMASLFFMEKWLRENSWIGFVFSLGMIVVKSAYFGYMVILFFAGYYLIRSVTEKRKEKPFSVKKFMIQGLLTCLLVATALMLAAVCFFPEVNTILNSPRTGKNIIPSPQLATFDEYFSLIFRLLGNSILGVNTPYLGWRNFYESPFMYIGILSLFFCVIALKEKWCRLLIITIAGLCVFCVPVSICFNAFNNVTYRWTFFFAPLFSLVVGKGFEMLSARHSQTIIIRLSYLIIGSILWAYLLYLYKNEVLYSKVVFYSILTALVFSTLYVILLSVKNRKRFSSALLVLFSIELGVMGYLTVTCERTVFLSDELYDWEFFSSSNKLIEQIEQQDTDFYRINKLYSRIDLNDGLAQNYRGEKLYSSTLHPSYWSIRKLFDLPADESNYFYGFEDRQSLRDINSVKYMLSQSDASYYRYEKIEESGDGYFAYKNNNAFPFGTQFQYYISENEYKVLSFLDQEAVLYDALIIPDELIREVNESGIEQIQTIYSGTLTSIPFRTVERDSGYQMQFYSATEFPLVIELYSQSDLSMSGAIYVLDETWNRTFEDGKNFFIDSGGFDQCVILRQGVSQIEITFDTSDHNVEFSAYLYNPENQQSLIQQKQNSGMKNVVFADDSYSGEIVLERNSLVYFPVLYDENWKLRANDIEMPVFCVNGGFCAVNLAAGEYTLELYYNPWQQRLAAVCSISTLVIIIFAYAISTFWCGRRRVFTDAQRHFSEETEKQK